MNTRTCRVGIHGRNDFTFIESDYALVRRANIETVKMMGQTRPEVYERLRQENSTIEFIVRLYDAAINDHPTPQEFVNRVASQISDVKGFATKFEVHNEPNHLKRYEGWGATPEDARNFNAWYLQVFDILKRKFPWAQFGFPGLAIPHGDFPDLDLGWIEVCRPAVEKSDFLCVHCYWQTPPGQENNHLADFWGLRFKFYHDKFPDKIIDITEFGNSNSQAEPPLPLPEQEMARQYVEYYQELFKYPYINSASSYISSSPDPTWAPFFWGEEVINAVGAMPRPRLVPARVVPKVDYGVEYVRYTPLTVIPGGERATFDVTLRNTGRKTWARGGPNPVHLGYHWYTLGGEPVAAVEDIRTELPRDVATGESVTLRGVPVSAPAEGGNFVLHVELVEEGVAWFSDHRVKPLVFNVQVTPPVVTAVEKARTFPETGFTVRGPFLEFFDKYGLDICGYPISDQIMADGYPSQYFQRIALEEYEPGKVRLKLVGTQAYTAQQIIAQLQQELEQARLAGGVGPAVVPKPDIRDITDSLPKHPTKRYPTRTRDQIEYLVIRHTGMDPSKGPDLIAKVLVERKDMPGIFYHYFIAADGSIYQTQRLETVVPFAPGHDSEGVCIVFAGRFDDTVPTEEQLASGGKLCAWLLQELDLPLEAVKGHKDFVVITSPGKQWDEGRVWRNALLEQIRQAQAEVSPVPAKKALGHYVLFWQYPDDWAKDDWLGAINYIGRFRPTCGFSVDDAMQADFVTIIGGPLGVSVEVEQKLRNAGCRVERIAGETSADTAAILDDMARRGQRFLTFDL